VKVAGYLPSSWDSVGSKPNRVQLKISGDRDMGWMEIVPEGPKQEAQINFMRCWGD